MKRIDPNEPVLTNNITAMTHEEAKMLTKYWHNGERLWKGKMPRHSFQLAPSESIRAFVFNYFQYECYKKSADEIADDDVNITDFWLEILPKILWLSEAWLDNGLFDEPWMAHWNPRIGKNVVHPGQTRSAVLEMFGQGTPDLYCVYFNTGGHYDPATMHSLEPFEIDWLIEEGWNTMTYVADHESIIPHFSKSIEENSDYKKEYHNRIIDRLSILGIETNTQSPHFLHYLRPWANRRRKNVEIFFEDDMPSYIDCSTALVCALLGRDYSNQKLKVTTV